MVPHSTRHRDLSESEIVGLCSDPNRQIIGGDTYGNLVVKLSDEVVVKFGVGVKADEYYNQRKAFDLLNPSIVRVPRTYRFFTQNSPGIPPIGFLVMQYIHGEVLRSPNAEQIRQIARILSSFSAIHGQRPGPLLGGVSRGLIWEENGAPEFENMQQMEKWLNFRLPDVEQKLVLKGYQLVLCHLDLAPRNIIRLQDGSMCFLDWGSAGFYPRFFEVSVLQITAGTHGTYEEDVMMSLKEMTEDEEIQMSLLVRSVDNGVDHPFVSRPQHSVQELTGANISKEFDSGNVGLIALVCYGI